MLVQQGFCLLCGAMFVVLRSLGCLWLLLLGGERRQEWCVCSFSLEHFMSGYTNEVVDSGQKLLGADVLWCNSGAESWVAGIVVSRYGHDVVFQGRKCFCWYGCRSSAVEFVVIIWRQFGVGDWSSGGCNLLGSCATEVLYSGMQINPKP